MLPHMSLRTRSLVWKMGIQTYYFKKSSKNSSVLNLNWKSKYEPMKYFILCPTSVTEKP